MRTLPILLISLSLILAGPVLAQQSGRGLVDHIPTVSLPTCSAATPGLFGYRIYDTTTNTEVTCSESAVAWVSSGGATLGLLTTGTIRGQVDVVVSVADTDSPAVDEMRGTMHIADNATAANDILYTLPEISTIGVGASACFYDNGGGDGGITLELDNADEFILDGTAITAGDQIDSPGVAGAGTNGDYICVLAIDATYWITLGRSGVWVDGGP